MRLAALALLLMTGCATKNPEHVVPAGSIHLYGCKEVAVNAKTQEITVICPAQGK
jgi:flagellar basal body L-ring protein FlgH